MLKKPLRNRHTDFVVRYFVSDNKYKVSDTLYFVSDNKYKVSDTLYSAEFARG